MQKDNNESPVMDEELYKELQELFQRLFANQLKEQISQVCDAVTNQEGMLEKINDNMNGLQYSSEQTEHHVKNLFGENEKIQGMSRKLAEGVNRLCEIQKQGKDELKQAVEISREQLQETHGQLEESQKQTGKHIMEKSDQLYALCEKIDPQMQRIADGLQEMEDNQHNQLQKICDYLMQNQTELEQRFLQAMEGKSQEQSTAMEDSKKEICELVCTKMEETLRQVDEQSKKKFTQLWVGIGVLMACNAATLLALFLR